METPRDEPEEEPVALTPKEAREVERRQSAPSRIVHEVIRRQGEEELNRPLPSLMWSGLAGGVGITASVVGKASLTMHVPDTEWRAAVTAIGYTLGFLIVVLGRLQLFTESTLSAVIPTATHPNFKHLTKLLRLWSVVLAANLAGTLAIALLIHMGWLAGPNMAAAMLEVSREILSMHGFDAIERGVPAGFLMAAIAWSLPSARNQEFFIVLLFTYFISLGGFAHVVAGSCEMWLLVLAGEASLSWGVFDFLLPALAGNILGGSVLFALLAHAQVRYEL